MLAGKKSMPDWHLFITQMERKWTKWYAMASHVIAYQSLELLFGTHTFHFNCFFEDFNCVFTQIRCLSRVLNSPCVYLQKFDRYHCARLVMECLCLFDDPSMNRMSVAICSILAAKVSSSCVIRKRYTSHITV